MTARVRFLFDYVSPYAYVASTQIRAIARRHGREVDAEPILFAALLDAHGTKGPAEVPAKRAYIFKDVVRAAHAYGVTIEPPAAHPFNPLLALRVTALVDDPDARWSLVSALYAAAWTKSERIDHPDVVLRVVTSAGLDGAKLVELASSPEAKARVRTATDAAIAAGVFGVPTMIADGEIFWGTDALPHVERRLRGDDPVDAALVRRWSAFEPAAERPGAKAGVTK